MRKLFLVLLSVASLICCKHANDLTAEQESYFYNNVCGVYGDISLHEYVTRDHIDINSVEYPFSFINTSWGESLDIAYESVIIDYDNERNFCIFVAPFGEFIIDEIQFQEDRKKIELVVHHYASVNENAFSAIIEIIDQDNLTLIWYDGSHQLYRYGGPNLRISDFN